MKVLQLIDSLEPGGAEKLAVNLANYLANEIEVSCLCVTRKEGLLKGMVEEQVQYLFLGKSGVFDLKALNKLIKYVRTQRINVIHAHSSSFFWATLVKMRVPKVRLVWHDHFGDRANMEDKGFQTLKFCSRYFHTTISVNTKLQEWSRLNLRCKNVTFLKNFVVPDTLEPKIELSGQKDLRIVCLANLRPQKDHLNLLRAFTIVQESYPMATLHCLGKKSNEEYCAELENFISDKQLKGVFLHGAQNGIHHLLESAAIGVLSSISEGLPLALLEYGLAGIPVVCTDVGYCKEVVGENGLVVSPGSPELLAASLMTYLSEKEKAKFDASRFSEVVSMNYSFRAILPILMNIYLD